MSFEAVPNVPAGALRRSVAVSEAQDPAASSGPRIIRTGSVRLEGENLDGAVAAVQGVATGTGGMVAGTELQEGGEGSRRATLNLRIPADSFDAAVRRISELGRVLSVSVNATDVSREYLDVETRMAVKEETVARLRELAARSGSVDDLLAAERELGRAIEELEVLKGRIRYFDRRLAQSDLQVSLLEPGAVMGSGAFRPLLRAFRDAGNVLGQSLAYLVYLIVFLVPWVILALLFWPLLRRWRRSRT